MKASDLEGVVTGETILNLRKNLAKAKNYVGETYSVDPGDGSEPFEVHISVSKPDRGPADLHKAADADAVRYRKLKAKASVEERDDGWQSFYRLPHVDKHYTAASRWGSFHHETLDEAVDAME